MLSNTRQKEIIESLAVSLMDCLCVFAGIMAEKGAVEWQKLPILRRYLYFTPKRKIQASI
ncbi:hypothetical protein [Psychromonas sp. CNPT3]|uniref:hypothetical protein n=1 Tax=Psychromonas sp. CNPT3 TaxID=314282 RepID=UPI00006E5687|nr:hypothetical protein [Psychromonas sp. CNPT3]